MPDDGKKTECVKVWMTERMFRDLSRDAMFDDRKLSDFIGLILERWAYGNTRQKELKVPDRDD